MSPPPAAVLWCDASIDEATASGGLAVYRVGGGIEFMRKVDPPVYSNVGLEREAVREALRIAGGLVAQGIRPVEIRTDCQNVPRGMTVKRSQRKHIRIVWCPRAGNLAHGFAYRAARV